MPTYEILNSIHGKKANAVAMAAVVELTGGEVEGGLLRTSRAIDPGSVAIKVLETVGSLVTISRQVKYRVKVAKKNGGRVSDQTLGFAGRQLMELSGGRLEEGVLMATEEIDNLPGICQQISRDLNCRVLVTLMSN